MAIHEWWASDGEERYWIEVTDREDLGADLLAPTTAHSGKETPSYTLVSHVNVGDIVLHWWKRSGEHPAFVGMSRAVAPVQTSTIDWQAHGSFGRTVESSVENRLAWRVPIANYQDFDSPVTLDDVRTAEPAIRRLRADLHDRHGDPLYFPFALSDKRPIRTAQGYLFKLPAQLLQALGISEALNAPRTRKRDAEPTATRPPAPRWQNDPAVRKAIERHAVDWTLDHFGQLGYLVEDVGATNSFDILALGQDDDELHIEVKGSSGSATTVEVTHGEVAETEAGCSVLVVVDQIEWHRTKSGAITTAGGESRIWWPWDPEWDRLSPTRYRYLLP